jgi:hypothetical protein
MYTIKKVATFEVRIYIGSHYGYTDEKFTFEELKSTIRDFQYENTCSVRIAPTTFFVKDYEEQGWEITAINYPRFPKPESEIYDFALGLASTLLEKFKQERISFVTANETVMLESTKSSS